MRVLITGAGGQLGMALTQRFSQLYEVSAFSRQDLDVADLDAVREAFRRKRPQVILHAAAMTNVDACEQDLDAAFRVNALGARNVAVAAQEQGAFLVHISTDYVFDGEKETPYTEFDPVNPINVYGQSKLAGEEYVRELCPRHLIARTAWLYSNGGKSDFVRTVLSLLFRGTEISMVDDQHGSPTYVPDLAATLEAMVQGEVVGVYHVAGGGECSRFEFARTIAEFTGNDPDVIRPVPTSAFPRPAVRPRRTPLEGYVSRLEGRTGLRPWRDALLDCLTDGK